MRRRWTAVGALLALMVLTGAAACSEGEAKPSATPTVSISPAPVSLTFGVFGPPAERKAYEDLAERYTGPNGNVTVKVVGWADRDEAARAYRSGEQMPDVFMASQRDLAWLTEHGLTQPVNELLDARGVSFGDDYSRDALLAFSSDNSLACMPYSISPMVIYYNTDLVNFDTMRRRGLDAPEDDSEQGQQRLAPTWNFDQFTAAAQFAARPARHTRGVYIEPTLLGLSPFIMSGGGNVFDDAKAPTSLAFSDGDTQQALETTLALLRDAQVTPTEQQLAHATGKELFEQGKLGMIAGFRSLTPELRTVPGLNFDVMPMPKISRSGTVGDVAGMCISADTEHVADAADFLVEVLSQDAVAEVARQGYMVPANVTVATSDAFLQPNREPQHAEVFNASVRDIGVPPQLDSWSQLESAAEPGIEELMTVPVLDDDTMGEITAEIDGASQEVLQPPSPTATTSPTDSPSSSG